MVSHFPLICAEKILLYCMLIEYSGHIDVFTVWITHSNEVFEFMRSSNDVIIDGDKIDDTNEEVALDANIFQHKVIALIIAL